MRSFEDFYNSRPRIVKEEPEPNPTTYQTKFPANNSLHCAPEIMMSIKDGYVGARSVKVELPKIAIKVDASAHAEAPPAELWERYYPKSQVNRAPYISITGRTNSIAVSLDVVCADTESAQRNAVAPAKFESG